MIVFWPYFIQIYTELSLYSFTPQEFLDVQNKTKQRGRSEAQPFGLSLEPTLARKEDYHFVIKDDPTLFEFTIISLFISIMSTLFSIERISLSIYLKKKFSITFNKFLYQFLHYHRNVLLTSKKYLYQVLSFGETKNFYLHLYLCSCMVQIAHLILNELLFYFISLTL